MSEAREENLIEQRDEARERADELRLVINACARALGNGAFVDGATDVFASRVPREIEGVVNTLRAELAEAKERVRALQIERDLAVESERKWRLNVVALMTELNEAHEDAMQIDRFKEIL